MTDAQQIKSTVKVCMFDQYGTVVDMQTGLVEAATPFLRAKGWQGNPNSFVTWWRRTHFENSMIDALLHKRAHAVSRDRRTLGRLCDGSRRHQLHDGRGARAGGQSCGCGRFPEVPAALDRLRTRYRLVVLSNGDPDMLEAAKRYHGVAFDQVISVAEANSFKPHVATYTKAAEMVGCGWSRCCSSPITRSTASARRRPACAPRSSTAASARSARRRISRICWCRA